MTDQSVLWGKFLADYAIWRGSNLPSPSSLVEAKLEQNQELVDAVTAGIYDRFEGSIETFGTIFPLLFRLEDYGQILLPVPVKNALGRNGIGDLSPLLTLTPFAVSRFTNVGKTIMVGLFEACLKASLWAAHSAPSVPQKAEFVLEEIEPDLELIGELKKRALLTHYEEQFNEAWNSVDRGHLNQLFRMAFVSHYLGEAEECAITIGGPTSKKTRHPIESAESTDFTAAQLLQDFDIPTYKELFSFFLETLDEKETKVCNQRLFISDSPSLDAVGVSLGVTRERVRQIEAKAIAKYKNLKLNNPVFSAAIEAFRLMTLEPILVSDLTKRQKQLSFSAGKGLGTLLEVLATLEKFSIVDSWVYADHARQTAAFDEVMSNLRAQNPLPSLKEILSATVDLWPSFTAKTLQKWLLANSWQEFSGTFVPARGLNQVDWAKIVLTLENKPMTPEAISARMPGEVSIRSFTNRLLEDPGITRTGISTYGLHEWGLEEFKSIHENLLDRVNESGSVSLDSVIRKFTEDFGASRNSVIQYAKVWPLTIINGEVRKSLVKEENAPTRRGAYKNVYKTADGYMWRTAITLDHLRGSGSGFPSGLAFELGVRQGKKKVFESDHGQIPVSIGGVATNIGSIRQFCLALEAEIGDQLAFYFSNEHITARKLNLALSGEDLVRELASLPADGDLRQSLEFALKSNADATLRSLYETLIKRKDTNIVEALSAL